MLLAPRHLPLVTRKAVDTPDDVYESLTDLVYDPTDKEASAACEVDDSGDASFDLDRGNIVCRKRGETYYFATYTHRTGLTPFIPMARSDAKVWIARMLSPTYTVRGWRLRVAIAELRLRRRELADAGQAFDKAVDTVSIVRSKYNNDTIRWATTKMVGARETFDRRYNRVVYMLYVVRYLLAQRRRLRLKSRQLVLPL